MFSVGILKLSHPSKSSTRIGIHRKAIVADPMQLVRKFACKATGRGGSSVLAGMLKSLSDGGGDGGVLTLRRGVDEGRRSWLGLEGERAMTSGPRDLE